MGNSSSVSEEGYTSEEREVKSKADRWADARRCISLLQVSFPDATLDTVSLISRETFLKMGHMPAYQEVQANLRPIVDLADKKYSGGKSLYLSYVASGNGDRRWNPGTGPPSAISADIAAAKAAKHAAAAAGGAVAVAVAAAAAGAAAAAIGAASAARAEAAGEAADLYATTREFLQEHEDFDYVWVASACLPPKLREERWRGAVPGVMGANMFDHMHPAAILACDAVLVAPPERDSLAWLPEQRERYSDLEVYSMSPWKALEGAITQLIGSVTYYAFRIGPNRLFTGPFGPPASCTSSRIGARRASAPVLNTGSRNDVDNGVFGAYGAARAKATATGVAKALLAAPNRWHRGDKDQDRGTDGTDRPNGGDSGSQWWTSGGTLAPSSVAKSNGRRTATELTSGIDGSPLERAVCEALDRFGIAGSGAPPERNWRGVIRPCYLLRKAKEDVEKFSDARGALKQAMCSMSVTLEQAEEFFGVWKHLRVMGPAGVADRLAALNILVFTVALADGHCCPTRPREFVGRVIEESLVSPGHLDLWMKDLSPIDSREILKSVNQAGRKLTKLTIGSSHTAGAGVGAFLRGHQTLKDLELEWEGVRDLSAISSAIAKHTGLLRLNLTHNEIGPRGAKQLGDALRRNGTLTEIDLRESNLGPTGMKFIADALAQNDSMRTLHLQDNAIGDDGVIAMTEALMRNGRLRTVCLDGNQVTDVGAKVICIAIQMNLALKLLGLSRNMLSDKSKRSLYQAWAQREGDHTGMFLDNPAEGTSSFRGGRHSGGQLTNVLCSASADQGTGGGILVSPTRDNHSSPQNGPENGPDSDSGTVRGIGSGGTRRGDGQGLLPGYSPVHEGVPRKKLW